MSAPAIAVDALSELQKRIALITSAEPADPSAALGTGIPELDAVLSRRGLPRGRLTEVTGARGSGKATLLRRMVMETISRGLGVAYVDASRTLAPRDWASVADEAGDAFWVVRPKQASRGAWCADVLLRSGAFALVVLDGAPPLTRSIAVRLTRLTHDAAAALVVVGGDNSQPSTISGALRLHVNRARKPRRSQSGDAKRNGERIARHVGARVGTRVAASPATPDRTRREITSAGADPPTPPGVMTRWMTITVEKGGRGQRQTVEVEHAVSVAHRLCAHPEVPDRRGAARTGGQGSRGREERSGTKGQQPGRRDVERQRAPELASVG
ncbi:MAG TPA: ATPase domain-containing protein [Gemmatimonadaceae bacterium]|jgi:RecA/RadA recombinase